MKKDELKELYGEFIEESRELVEEASRLLVSLEQAPDDDDLVDKIFRCFHTLKGNAGFIGFAELSDIFHRMESVLGKVRDKEFAFFSEINDILFKGLDISKGLLADFIAGKKSDIDLTIVHSELDGLLTGPAHGEVEAPAESKLHDESDRRRQDRRSKDRRDEEGEAAAAYMRVATSRLDKLVNLVGELAAGRSRLMQLSAELKDRAFDEVTSFIASISSQIQAEVLSVRMVPIRQVFNKFYRLVRDISRPLGKDVELKVIGEETELDKTIIEVLNDPLLHMVRNAIGHGIESPEERKEAGKSEKGTVTLRAYHEQNYVFIEVEDDGKGLFPDRIRQKALEKGAISPEDSAEMSDAAVVRLIFSSGFSTATEVNDLSGRGVGMDVVRTNIELVGGTVDVTYKEGEGSKFTLKMPLTLAIVQLFLLKEAGQTFGLPLSYVEETIRIQVNELEHIKGQMIYMLRHDAVPIFGLSEALGIDYDRGSPERIFVVVVRIFQRKVGFIVDEFSGKVETVIKPLGNYIDSLPKPVEGISGASILGTGEVVLVLDAPAIFKSL